MGCKGSVTLGTLIHWGSMRLRITAAIIGLMLALPASPVISANSVTLSVSGFSTTATSMNSKQSNLVKSFLRSPASPESITCTGWHKTNAKTAEKTRVRARATSVCNAARTFFPGVPRVIRLASSSVGTRVGTVQMTLRFQNSTNGAGPSSQPAPSPDRPKSPHYSYRFNNGVLERKGSLENSWRSSSDFENGIHPIRAAAFANVKAQARTTQSAGIDWLIGANAPAGMVESYRIQAANALRFLPLENLKTPIQVLIVSEKDRNTVQEFWSSYWGGTETIIRINSALDNFEENQASRSVAGAAGARTSKVTNNTTVGIDFYVGSQHQVESHLLVDHVAHEMVHVWQFFSFGQTEMRTTPGPNVMALVPCHLMEGGANALGVPISTPHADWHSEAMDVIVRRVLRDIGSSSPTREQVVRFMIESENWSSCQAGYGIGALAHEWLIGSFGVEKFFRLYPETIKAGSFDSALKSVYGMDRTEFYERASAYVVEAIALAR